MDKKEYVAPTVTVYGDVESLTLGGGVRTTTHDGVYIQAGGGEWEGFDPPVS